MRPVDREPGPIDGDQLTRLAALLGVTERAVNESDAEFRARTLEQWAAIGENSRADVQRAMAEEANKYLFAAGHIRPCVDDEPAGKT